MIFFVAPMRWFSLQNENDSTDENYMKHTKKITDSIRLSSSGYRCVLRTALIKNVFVGGRKTDIQIKLLILKVEKKDRKQTEITNQMCVCARALRVCK